MRLGVYCSDDRVTGLLTAWRSYAEYVWVSASETGTALKLQMQSVAVRSTWEELLTDSTLAAVLVGGTDADVLDAARKFSQAGTPLWVLPHPRQGLLFAYELNLAAQETNATLMAVFPHRGAAVWQACDGDAQVPAPTYVEFVRHIPASGNEATLAVSDVDRFLLNDLDLLTWQLGARSRVTTLRSGETGATIRRQTVTLAGDDVPEIVWSIEPSPNSTVTAECRFHAGGQTVRYFERDGLWSRDGQDLAASRPPAPFSEAVPWSAAITAFELLDAVEHSLERKRTIELHREAVSERAIFKTRMAAWGCGVLILTLFLMVAFLMVASVVPLHGTLLAIGRAAVFTPVFVFLLAQLLLPLTRSAKK